MYHSEDMIFFCIESMASRGIEVYGTSVRERERDGGVEGGAGRKPAGWGLTPMEAFTSVGPPLLPLHVKPGGTRLSFKDFLLSPPSHSSTVFCRFTKPSNTGVKRHSLRVLKVIRKFFFKP